MEIAQPQSAQIFQAAWPEGHEPIFPPYTEIVASIALVIFTAYYATGLAIFCGIAVAAFWAVRKVAAWVIHMSAGPFATKNPFTSDNRETLKQTYSAIEMRTPDGFKLDGILHEGTHKKAVIYCPGNDEYYESGASYLIGSLQTSENISVLLFNPRGVLESEGTSSPEMLQYDAYTAFEYLVSLGYQPENICIIGYSLGGAYGTLGAALAQAKYPETSLAALPIYTFATLPLEVQHLLGNGICGKVASIFIHLFGWEMDVATAWNSLKSKNKTLFCHVQDGIIPFEASLHQATPDNGIKICYGEPNGTRHIQYHMIDSNGEREMVKALQTILSLTPSQYSDDTPL